ncbi:MAG: type II toxin-antitoxin system VapB family antitoxin [Steroidobacteraceae bacterium]
MKTTLDISDPLLVQARKIAARDGETLRSLVEQGLRTVVAERTRKAASFRLRDASVGGEGLQPEFQNAPWDKWRDLIYEGYGT